MGGFDLWRGNLSEMRGDSENSTASASRESADTDRFLQTLAISRAFDNLPPKCEAAIRLACVDGRDISHVTNKLNVVPNCVRRLLLIAEDQYRELIALSDVAAGEVAQNPYHSAAGGR